MLSNETHQLESRMRETRLSGSEGGVAFNPPSLPLSLSAGALRLELAVTGAQVERSTMGSGTATGAKITLNGSGRKIAYSRLRVTDATGKESSARMEVLTPNLESRKQKAEMGLVVLVDDTDAVYPIRIDPTFSDVNWISMGGIPGADDEVNAAVVDGSGNLYIGGDFGVVCDVYANHIAKWDGSSWSPLGSGVNDYVRALAVSGSDLYAGGQFTTAGGKVSTYVARAILSPLFLTLEPDGAGGYFIRFSGVPGSAYRLERAPTLTGPWAPSSAQTSPASGRLEFWDIFPPPDQGFYRALLEP